MIFCCFYTFVRQFYFDGLYLNGMAKVEDGSPSPGCS